MPSLDYHREPHGVYFLIDNKSFYASVECIERGFNPLKAPLVVMSEADNTNGGLVLATSPEAKLLYHLQANVSRQRDLPADPRLVVVPPRMTLYIQRNLQINAIFNRFVADYDLLPYSIDESILDLTHSWHLFGETPRAVAQRIQHTIRHELGLYTTVGIGDNPVQAKLALDLYAKHTQDLIGEIHYDTVQETIWPIKDLTSIWGIGHRTAKHLQRLGIHTMADLAHANPYLLKQELGLIGTQLFAVAWGIDRSQVAKPSLPQSTSLGNSQVLPRDYHNVTEIETVIKEVGEQVASRLRHHHQLAGAVSLSIGFAYAASEMTGESGFSQVMRIDPTDQDRAITAPLITLFKQHWHGQAIRNIAVYTAKLQPKQGQQLSLFTGMEQQLRTDRLAQTVDQIRSRFGFTKLVYLRSLVAGGTAIQRASLVGGHNGGNAYD
ncbi:excinuclease ABC subunit A [Lactobacillus paracollinoides] [Lactiplantibacillus mudanjiangensis]|uniref:Y-family DNA polymerase n=1 Tax=Lactiplantibacillus mudanjiangensis TaxID=1296538 RepID=UPI001014ACB6|nr:excinuclease ABC subunit A [Lactobacillus paracollinoides] [Lactiplantibacillus mudanjiangensis]